MAKTEKKPHHHGNLREALVDAGIRLLEEQGAAGLTLRKCAAMAGVTHAAPGHHFAGLAGLKAAIAAVGFRRFTKAMRDEAAQSNPPPRAQLAAICRGYLDFADQNGALFGLIFSNMEHFILDEDLKSAGQEAYGVLREACAPFTGPDHPAVIVETQVWSLIHGYASLRLARKFRADAPGGAGGNAYDEVMALLDRIGAEPGED